MTTFALNSRLITCAEARIETGRYPKQDESEPDQIGWRVWGDGDLLGTPTVNLWGPPPLFPEPGCVFIKITPEYAAGIVERTGRIEGAGFVESYAAECRVLLPELLEA